MHVASLPRTHQTPKTIDGKLGVKNAEKGCVLFGRAILGPQATQPLRPDTLTYKWPRIPGIPQ